MVYIFSERLQKSLDRANKKPVDLSNATGISQALISQWLSDKAIAKNDKISLIAEYLNVSESFLAGFTDEIGYFNIENSDNSIYGDHQANLDYFADKPELLNIYKEIHNSESLQLLFDSAKDLTPQDLETVLMIISGIKKERGQ